MHLRHPPSTRAIYLSLLSNAVLAWNTMSITQVLERLPTVRHEIADQDLARSSLLMHAHVIPNGKYRVGE
jgi:Tn3 transposase DDE domain